MRRTQTALLASIPALLGCSASLSTIQDPTTLLEHPGHGAPACTACVEGMGTAGGVAADGVGQPPGH